LRRLRKEAEIAWHEKNYAALIETYNSMKDDLTPVEAKKLAYAQKHLHSS
jgi:hypothetical protein